MQQLRLFFKASLSFEIMRPLQHLRDNLNLKRETWQNDSIPTANSAGTFIGKSFRWNLVIIFKKECGVLSWALICSIWGF